MGKLLLLTFSLVVALSNLSNAQLYKVAKFGKSCSPGSVIMPTVCNVYGRSVKCSSEFQGKCVCNLGSDAEFDEDEQACVGLVDTLCFTDANSLGRKICTKNADCTADPNPEPGHIIGTCQCLLGYRQTPNKTCEQIPDYVGEIGTMRPTTVRFQTPSTTPIIHIDSTNAPSPQGSGNSWIVSGNFLVVFIQVLFTFVRYNLF